MLDGDPYTSDAICAEPCEVFSLRREKILPLMDSDPALGYILSQRLLRVMKKRLDMIEQLLGAVKGYVKHEREIFENIAKLRQGIDTAEPGKLGEIEQESRTITSSLLAVAEAYPDLKASETTQKLMEAVIDVEDEIARDRYTFNNIVQQYNTMQDTIPSSLLAGYAGASKMGYLEFEEKIENPPDISPT